MRLVAACIASRRVALIDQPIVVLKAQEVTAETHETYRKAGQSKYFGPRKAVPRPCLVSLPRIERQPPDIGTVLRYRAREQKALYLKSETAETGRRQENVRRAAISA